MTPAGQTLELSALDALHPVTPDPAILRRNLAALGDVAPEFAQRLRSTPPPDGWRPARTPDGCTSYRCEATGAAPAWAAGTALPRVRADALLRDYHWGELNASLPGVAAGAELVRLLEKLPPTSAVFVFEPDVRRLAAVLAIVDLSAALGARRCVLVPPEEPAAYLERLLRQFPGLLPPGNILRLPECDEAHIAEIHALCTRLGTEFAAARRARIDALRARNAGPETRPGESERLALFVLAPGPAETAFAEHAAASAAALGWACEVIARAGPTDAHPLALAERCAAFDPTCALVVNPRPPLPPLPWPPAVGFWHFAPPPTLPGAEIPGVRHLAATPRIARRLRAAGVPAERVSELRWPAIGGPCESDRTPVPQSGSELAVLLCGEFPDPHDSANGIEQPTHRLIWQHLRQAIEHTWDRGPELDAERLLAGVERRTGLRIDHASTRQHLLDRAADALIPAVVGERILQTLQKHGFRAFALGKGWDLCTPQPADTIPGSIFTSQGRARVRALAPLAAIAPGGAEPFAAEMPTLVAMGVPLLAWGASGDLPLPRTAWRGLASEAELVRTLESAAAARRAQPPVQMGAATDRSFGEALRAWAAQSKACGR